ncbi:WD40 repeat-like protein [Zopfia rhizophila CBS 207.26]|uniref:WD40 repeat-like protein n=1 Tax=Zopfia rhizophila CBS 207.26 TaxID=1314779 RepID=A0A6A6ERQ0_9PEZI|nr:WD40 repeat-like protein [Zopfia rhizophila CBS 207.26]
MRLLLHSNTGEVSLTKDLVGNDVIPPYAILSHTWGADTEEVTFEDLTSGTGKDKPGYEKIRFCGEQARQDDLQYFWVDTCCINKANYTELSQAINSMFRWYRNATRCYVYLSDVSSPAFDTNEEFNPRSWESDFRNSRWFKRGWTLQELLAPSSVEFFSQERKRLGDKRSLNQQIHEIAGISDSALRGVPLSRFSVDERLSWLERRQTKLDEDKAYSLLGIFDVHMPLIYGEGRESAFKRLREEIDKSSVHMRKEDKECVQHLHLTDPRDDKMRIEETKGGLLEGCYHWILENSDFQRWRNDQQSPLLWIKGDPGKGKTMLLCGIVNELKKSKAKTDLLSYFFCQATDPRINNATAVLRGLVYLLVDQQPSLISHIRKKYDYAGKTLFEDANAWVALSEIFTNILQDPSLNNTFLIIDALDECVANLPKLLDFIVQKSSISRRVKWIVSSRNWPDIEERLERAGHRVRLCLELNAESISMAVSTYIRYKVLQLAQRKKYDDKTRDAVLDHLSLGANNTFLWVALVCQNLEKISRWNIFVKLNAFPPGLDPLYERMMKQICNSDDADLCKQILASIAIVCQPITLKELASLVEMLEDMSTDLESLEEIITLCGSFLTTREGTIYFVHQSAKDYLFTKAFDKIFPSGREEAHYVIFSRSLLVMSRTLRRDIYNLRRLGYPIERIEQQDPDPLAVSRYSCIYWVNHLCDSCANHGVDLRDGGAVDEFVRKKFLYWLEALSLCRSMSHGVVSMAKLEALIQGRADASALIELVRDARRFIMYHKLAIEKGPLQAYASALVFSPARSLIRGLFKKEEPKWISIKPAIGDKWSACLQTLEGHRDSVRSVAFSYDSARLASASTDRTVKIWDARSGECLKALTGHSNTVRSVAFSHDSARLASASTDSTVKIWDARSGKCLQTLKGHSYWVQSVAFSHDSARLASASSNREVMFWDASSGECLQTLIGHSSSVNSVAFSHDSARLASASGDHTVKIWDASSGACLRTLMGHSSSVRSVAFSHDSARLASASGDRTVKIWDARSGECLQTLMGHSSTVYSVAFSHDSARLASASIDSTVKIWDARSSECLQTVLGHSNRVYSVAFSHDSARLASASDDRTVKVWDAGGGECLQTPKGHSNRVNSVAFSHGSARLASASNDRTIKVWDASSGECLQTLEGHSSWAHAVAFSHDSARLASASIDSTVKIWDASSGACLQTLMGHSGSVNSVAFSHDSARLASASNDCRVKIWDARSGACLQTLIGHSGSVNSVAFSHDSARLASASNDREVMFWDASSGECLQTLSVSKALFNISFDTSGLYLHTEIGTIAIDVLSASNMTPSVTEPQNPRYQGWDLNSDGAWITYNSENIVWLPSEYRPSCSAVSGNTIGIGVGSGKVWIYNFKADNA